MKILLIIAVLYLEGVRLSIAREDQTAEMRDELSLLVRRVNNLEEEKDIENKEFQVKIENVQTENKELQEKIERVQTRLLSLHVT